MSATEESSAAWTHAPPSATALAETRTRGCRRHTEAPADAA